MNKRKVLMLLLMALFLVVFCISGAYVIHYFTESASQKAKFDELSDIVASIQATATTEPSTPSPDSIGNDSDAEGDSASPEQTEPVMLPEYAALYAINADLVGWIRIDGTVIDYPVMQTPSSENYYLKRNFYSQVSAQGCIYVREVCDVFTPSDNVTIYGHHMRDGSMFAGLSSYSSQSYWEDHRIIHFDTLYEHHDYQIFAVFKTTASVGKGFSYHLFVDAENEAEFDSFISQCTSLSLYDTGITPQYGDKIICLSTCDYSQTNGRLVVAAVRIN